MGERSAQAWDSHPYNHDAGINACRACGGSKHWPVHDTSSETTRSMTPNRPAEPRAEPATAAGAGIPNTRAGRLLLGKNSGSDRDPATVEWLLNDILAIEAEARAATPPALDGPLFSPESEHCHTCGRPVGLVWTAPDELWAGVTGITTGGGIRCIPCFDAEATAQGRFIRWVPQDESARPSAQATEETPR